MNKRPIIVILGAAALLAASVGASAQATDPMLARHRMRQNVSTLRMVRLTQALDLTEDQAARLLPLVNRLEKEKLVLQQEMTRDLQELRRTIRTGVPGPASAGTTEDARILGLVGRVNAARRDLRLKDEELEKAMETDLTPVQRARYVLFQIDFYQGLGETLNDLRRLRQAPMTGSPAIKK